MAALRVTGKQATRALRRAGRAAAMAMRDGFRSGRMEAGEGGDAGCRVNEAEALFSTLESMINKS